MMPDTENQDSQDDGLEDDPLYEERDNEGVERYESEDEEE